MNVCGVDQSFVTCIQESLSLFDQSEIELRLLSETISIFIECHS